MHGSCVASPTPPRRIMNHRQKSPYFESVLRVRTLDATSWQQYNEPRAHAPPQFSSILTRPHNEPRAHAPPQFSSILTRPHRDSTHVFHPEIPRHNVPRPIRHLQLFISFLRRPCHYSVIYPSIKAPIRRASIRLNLTQPSRITFLTQTPNTKPRPFDSAGGNLSSTSQQVFQFTRSAPMLSITVLFDIIFRSMISKRTGFEVEVHLLGFETGALGSRSSDCFPPLA